MYNFEHKAEEQARNQGDPKGGLLGHALRQGLVIHLGLEYLDGRNSLDLNDGIK
jgi:hypothetical protein